VQPLRSEVYNRVPSETPYYRRWLLCLGLRLLIQQPKIYTATPAKVLADRQGGSAIRTVVED